MSAATARDCARETAELVAIVAGSAVISVVTLPWALWLAYTSLRADRLRK
jgi:hypothetical protein